MNDAGFWLVKEYFGLTVAETFKYWTTMETLLSILGLTGVLLASLIARKLTALYLSFGFNNSWDRTLFMFS